MERNLAIIIKTTNSGFLLSIGTLAISFDSFERNCNILRFFDINRRQVASMTTIDYRVMVVKDSKLREIGT